MGGSTVRCVREGLRVYKKTRRDWVRLWETGNNRAADPSGSSAPPTSSTTNSVGSRAPSRKLRAAWPGTTGPATPARGSRSCAHGAGPALSGGSRKPSRNKGLWRKSGNQGVVQRRDLRVRKIPTNSWRKCLTPPVCADSLSYVRGFARTVCREYCHIEIPD
jgi:hypothetical protein